MTFKLTIDMDNAAFEEPNGEELSRIFLKLHSLFQGAQLESDFSKGKLRDINGNTVGEWEVYEH